MNKLIKAIYILLIVHCITINAFAQCESGGHSTHPDDNWQSCTTSTNAAGRTGHWIRYDFGTTYNLLTSHFWNYNVVGEVGKGFKDVQIDYSVDGTNWTTFGIFSFTAATGGNDYAGEAGPDFGDIAARYLLITAVNNHDGNVCSGFGELKINVKNCTRLMTGAIIENVTCDEGGAIQLNPAGGFGNYTIQWADAGSESYRADLVPGNYTVSITDERGCTISQQINIPFSEASTSITNINDLPIPSDTFRVAGIIESTGFITQSGNVSFLATGRIDFLPGFQANSGSNFLAEIIPCVPTIMSAVSEEVVAVENNIQASSPVMAIAAINNPTILNFNTHPNPFWNKTTIDLTLTKSENINIGIFSLLGREIKVLLNNGNLSAGKHQFTFSKETLTTGMYIIKVYNKAINLSRKVVLIEGV
ncbi:MAG: 3-coathanger stack domain-containing protein [Bacteroidota bacterium]